MDALVRTIAVGVIAAAVAAGATAWIVDTSGHSRNAASVANTDALPTEGAADRVPLGDIAGTAETRLPDSMANPLENDPEALNEGQRLFNKMNCAGCHGYTGKGGMGPDLTDTHWRYGGTPVQIFKSIYEGRPKGMPAWGRALPKRSIWELTKFVESLGGSFPANAYHSAMDGDLADQGASSSKSPAHNSGGGKRGANAGQSSTANNSKSG